jgi:hypothetical protein
MKNVTITYSCTAISPAKPGISLELAVLITNGQVRSDTNRPFTFSFKSLRRMRNRGDRYVHGLGETVEHVGAKPSLSLQKIAEQRG